MGDKTIGVTIHWVESAQMWHMRNAETEKHIQEFYDCDVFAKTFIGAEKNGHKNKYKITVERV